MKIETNHRLITIHELTVLRNQGKEYRIEYELADAESPHRPKFRVFIVEPDKKKLLTVTAITAGGPEARLFVFGPTLYKFNDNYNPDKSGFFVPTDPATIED